MKWNTSKKERWSLELNGLKATQNNNKFEIRDKTEGWGRLHVGWYIFVKNKKTQKIFNFMQKEIYFVDIEEAKIWCENFKWENIEEKE